MLRKPIFGLGVGFFVTVYLNDRTLALDSIQQLEYGNFITSLGCEDLPTRQSP